MVTLNPNDIEKGRWRDMLSIAYSTRPTLPSFEREITIEFSRDCADNLAGLFGLIPEIEEEFTHDFSSQIQKQIVDPDNINKYVFKSGILPWFCGKLNIKLVDGYGIFDLKFR